MNDSIRRRMGVLHHALIIGGLALAAGGASAADWYVSNTRGALDANGNEIYDGRSATAAGASGPFFRIQNAIEAASAGDTVHVAAGTYGDEQGYVVASNFQNSRSRIWIKKAITVRGENRDTTIIRGAHDPVGVATNGLGAAAVRCVAIAHAQGTDTVDFAGVRLENFTLTGGATQNNESDGMGTRGGGVAIPQNSHRNYIVNCLIKGNAATRGGGGFGGTYVNCVFDGNRSDLGLGGRNGGACRTCSLLGCVILNTPTMYNAVGYIRKMLNCTLYGNRATCSVIEETGEGVGEVWNTVVLGNTANSIPTKFDRGGNIAKNYEANDTAGDLVAAAFGDFRPVAGGCVAAAGVAEALAAFQTYTGISDDLRDYDLLGQPRVRADGRMAAGAVATPIQPQGAAFKALNGGVDVLFDGRQLCKNEMIWADVWPKQVYLTCRYSATTNLVCYMMKEKDTVTDQEYSTVFFPDRQDGYWLTYPSATEPHAVPSCAPAAAVCNSNVVRFIYTVRGTVRHVDGSSTSDTEDGSAANPYKTIQAAVAAPTQNSAIRVRVAPGVYGGTREAATRVAINSGDSDGGLATVCLNAQNSFYIRADEGPARTVIKGVWADTQTGIGTGAVRCVAFTRDVAAGISGFTLEDGATEKDVNENGGKGGGFFSIISASRTICPRHQMNDCIVRRCTAGRGSGAYGGWYRRVRFENNVTPVNHYLREAVLSGCVIGPNPGNQAVLVGQNVYCLNSTILLERDARGYTEWPSEVVSCVNCLFFGGRDGGATARDLFAGNYWDGAPVARSVGNVTHTTVRVADFAHGDYRPLAGEPVVGGGSSDYKFFGRHTSTDFDNNPIIGVRPRALTAGAFVTSVSAVVAPAVAGVSATGGGTNVLAVGETHTVTFAKEDACRRNLIGLTVDGVRKEGVFSWTVTGTDPATCVDLAPLFTTDWYVDAKNGADANDGWTPATARRTLAAAMADVVPGDTVHAAEGDYCEKTALPATTSGGGEQTKILVPSRVVVPSGVSLVATGARDRTRIIGRAADCADADYYYPSGWLEKTNLGSYQEVWRRYGVGTNGSVKCVTLLPRARIRGFTLTGGRTGCKEDVGADFTLGAAVMGYDAQTSVVEDCLVTNNATGRANIYKATAINCEFRDNVALWNGAFGRIARFIGSRFRDNVSPAYSSDFCYGFYNCTIDANWADADRTRPLSGLAKEGPTKDDAFQLVNTIVMGLSKEAVTMNRYGDVLNCVFETGFEKDRAFTVTNVFENVAFAAREDVLKPSGRTRSRSAAVIGKGDPARWLAAWGDRDIHGNARFLDGKIDIGPEQFDPARLQGFLILCR